MIYLEITNGPPHKSAVLRDSLNDRVVARGALVADTPPGNWSAPEGIEVSVTLRFVGIGTGTGLATE
jgi:hypothetical protein